MLKIIGKPIAYNSNGYSKPSGNKSTKGFHKENGYGHEEWNNSARLIFKKGSLKYRAFHTEEIGNLNNTDTLDAFIVFMYTMKDNKQYLVGIASQARCLIHRDEERKKLAKTLNVLSFKEEAWDSTSVQKVWGGYEAEWDDHWNTNAHWLPNWICRERSYLWLDSPVLIDPEKIAGKKKLIQMYSSYQNLTPRQASVMMHFIPKILRNEKWHRIMTHICVGSDTLIEDINDLFSPSNSKILSKTKTKALVDARLGQGKFRKALDEKWDNRCSASGIGIRALLRASHIKPWGICTDKEKLDPSNGLLLAAHIDALFDKGLITFSEKGKMILSNEISKDIIKALNLPNSLTRKPDEAEAAYLEFHRSNVFVG